MELASGLQLLHYRLVEKIGGGGMGVVWKATDTTLDREAAIKVLPDDFAMDPERLTADVLRAPIELKDLPTGTPRSIRRLIERCLERDKMRRLRDIGEARIALEDVIAERSLTGESWPCS